MVPALAEETFTAMRFVLVEHVFAMVKLSFHKFKNIENDLPWMQRGSLPEKDYAQLAYKRIDKATSFKEFRQEAFLHICIVPAGENLVSFPL